MRTFLDSSFVPECTRWLSTAFFAACLALLSGGLAEGQAPVVSPATDVEFVTTPKDAASFGGGIIAVTLIDGRQESLRFIDLDTGIVSSPVYENVTNGSFPGFSPDGLDLTFASRASGGIHIYTAPWYGGRASQITDGSGAFGNPAWSRDGKSVVFYGELSNGDRELMRASLTPGRTPSISQLTSLGGENSTPVESPVSGLIAFSTNRLFPGWDVCFLNPGNNQVRCPLGNLQQTFCRPRWHPSGARIVYSMGTGSAIDLYQYTLNTGAVSRLTRLAFSEYDGTFSPDGAHVAFVYDPDGDHRYELWIVRVSDGRLLRVATASGSLRYPSWSHGREYQLAGTDECPDDPAKIESGLCGCGTSDGDRDQDGAPDCIDECPEDRSKTEAGGCGCGVSERTHADGSRVCGTEPPPTLTATSTPTLAPSLTPTVTPVIEVRATVGPTASTSSEGEVLTSPAFPPLLAPTSAPTPENTPQMSPSATPTATPSTAPSIKVPSSVIESDSDVTSQGSTPSPLPPDFSEGVPVAGSDVIHSTHSETPYPPLVVLFREVSPKVVRVTLTAPLLKERGVTFFIESRAGTFATTRERRRMRMVLKPGTQVRFAWCPVKSPTHSPWTPWISNRFVSQGTGE